MFLFLELSLNPLVRVGKTETGEIVHQVLYEAAQIELL